MSSLKLIEQLQQGLKGLSKKLGKSKNLKIQEMNKRIKEIGNKIKEKFNPKQQPDKKD